VQVTVPAVAGAAYENVCAVVTPLGKTSGEPLTEPPAGRQLTVRVTPLNRGATLGVTLILPVDSLSARVPGTVTRVKLAEETMVIDWVAGVA
jgi:hypothetical protein